MSSSVSFFTKKHFSFLVLCKCNFDVTEDEAQQASFKIPLPVDFKVALKIKVKISPSEVQILFQISLQVTDCLPLKISL